MDRITETRVSFIYKNVTHYRFEEDGKIQWTLHHEASYIRHRKYPNSDKWYKPIVGKSPAGFTQINEVEVETPAIEISYQEQLSKVK
jgi:hypothetical protein